MSYLTNHITTLATSRTRSRMSVFGDLGLTAEFKTTKGQLGRNLIIGKTQQPSGGARVAIALRKLGFHTVDLYGVVGDDPGGRTLVQLMNEKAIDTSHVYSHSAITTNETLSKQHTKSFSSEVDGYFLALIKKLEKNLTEYGCVIIVEDQRQSLFTEEVRRALQDLSRHGQPIIHFTDLEHHIPGTLALISCPTAPSEEELLRYSKEEQATLFVPSIDEGATAYEKGERWHELGFHFIKEAESEGAIEAFAAGCALSLAAGGSSREALGVGNLAKGVVIQPSNYPQGLSLSAIEALSSSVERRYEPALAADVSQAHYLEGTEIEIIDHSYSTLGRSGYPVVAIFDLDGTLSTLREGWDEVMRDTMVAYITGSHLNTLSSEVRDQLHAQVERLIERTTGVQTVIQMQEMMDLLQSYQYVPEEEMASAHQYKDWYAQKIRDRVAFKFTQFKNDELGLDEFTLKGAIEFLTHLRERNVRLYLASGTDDSDIKHELATFGYADLFDGGIYGSIGDVANDPKALVVSKAKQYIIEHKGSFGRGDGVVFGDGPVEIREGKAEGFLTVGMVSDEKRRSGLNLKKRERLILAGSDFLMSDYSWAPHLGSYLGWQNS